MLEFDMDTREFNATLRELDRVSRSNSTQIVRMTGKFVLKTLVRITGTIRAKSRSIKATLKRATNADTESSADYWLRRAEWKLKYADRARAGWWAAWAKLGMSGTPMIRNSQIRGLVGNEGSIVDNSASPGTPHIIMANEAPHIEDLDDDKKIVQSALNKQAGYMQKTLDKIYMNMLKGRSG